MSGAYFPSEKTGIPCKYCGDELTIEDVIADKDFCSDECALADLTGDESFVFIDEEQD